MTRWLLRSPLIIALLAAQSAGCPSRSLTEIIVVVDTDLEVGREIVSVRVDVDDSAIGGHGDASVLLFLEERPATVGLVHDGGSLGPIDVTASGLVGTSVVITRRARVSFVEGHVLVLRLDLLAICRDVQCAEEQTCMDDGVCHDASDAEMTEWDGQAHPLDASTPDADLEADADADSDADMDSGGDAFDGDVEDADDGSTCSPDAEEVCNGLDDDCDGVVDEGFDLVVDSHNCGACDHICPGTEPCVARACRSDPVAVTAGESHSCALTSTGGVRCWGSNLYGQLGTGETDPFPIDGVVDVVGLPGLAIDVAAGARHTCAAIADPPSVWCWGDDASDQLGEGYSNSTPGPVQVSGEYTPVAVTSGTTHSCLLTDSGAAYCWGDNPDGRLGDYTTSDRYTPSSVYGSIQFIQISAGDEHTCGISSRSEVYCWGNTTHGRLGVATSDYRRPSLVVDAGTATQVVAGGQHTCALTVDGGVLCWGYNGSGQLGTDTVAETTTPVAVTDDAGASLRAVWLTAGANHTCATLRDGTTLCWGDNGDGQLGIGDETVDTSSTPLPVVDLSVLVRASAGTSHSCARDDSDRIWCWGANISYQLGVSGTQTRYSPIVVRGF